MLLILCTTKILYGTGNISVLCSDFFVIQVLVDMNKTGFYELGIIKKRWQWPHYTDGEK